MNLTTEADHQTKEFRVISHKTDLVDQIVEIISIEVIIRDQTQTDQNIRLIPVPIYTLGIDTISMIDQEIHCTIDIKIVLTIRIKATKKSKSTISKQLIKS